MGNIQVLDELTIDKIAAGEVIERPASVVKELVENAIDSQANAITIEIKDGGIGMIRITDNGCGILADDVPTAFLRHATSKIRTAADLLSVTSLGFRGEALSSISAVAQVELITKTAAAITGVRYLIAGGKEQSIEHVGCPEGTTFIVRNLFYNVPARRKFLKTAQTEGAHIYELVQQLALSHPEISFQFIMNGQNRFHTSGNGNVKDIIYTVYGRDVANSLLAIAFSNEALQLRVEGFLGKPIVSRGNRTFENYYINQRYIKSPVIYKAVEDAYKTFTMVHRFPFVCLKLDMSPETLDVNVHPAKMELKFRDERALYDVLKREVRSVLLNQDLIPDVSLDSKRTVKVVQKEAKRTGAQPFEQKRRQLEQRTATPAAPEKKPSMVAETTPAWTDLPQKQAATAAVEEPAIQTADSAIKEPAMQTADAVVKEPVIQTAESVAKEPTIPTVNAVTAAKEPANPSLQPPAGKTTPAPQQLTFADEGFLAQAARPKHRLIGQLFQTYWLIEYDKKLFIMDQHAAHEKVNYERFMKHRKEKSKRYVQQVSPPIVVTMTPKEASAYEEYKDYFAEFGFEISDFGDSEYAIHGVPTDLYGIADKDAFIGLLDEIVENVHGTQADMIAGKIATMACKASVKGGQRLSFEEAEQLIDELLTLDSPFTCPHGRPTIISMTQTEIEKKFKRIQDR